MSDGKVIIRKKDRVEFILSGLCSYYNIEREELLRKARTPERYNRKGIAVKLLRDVADLSFKEITSIFGNTGENTNWVIYQRVEENREYNNVLKYMGI
jgi:chromosomal replication initiation ATPase DnaA